MVPDKDPFLQRGYSMAISTLGNKTAKLVDVVKGREYFENKISFTTGPVELSQWMVQGWAINIIDVREVSDYKKSHIPGAINLPRDRWETLRGLSKDRNNVLYCYSQTCHLASSAAAFFAEQGYPVIEMEGGFKAWQGHFLPETV